MCIGLDQFLSVFLVLLSDQQAMAPLCPPPPFSYASADEVLPEQKREASILHVFFFFFFSNAFRSSKAEF